MELYYAAYKVDILKDDPLVDDPWQWWIRRCQKQPITLFKIAGDFLSIPNTSCDCKQYFSSGGRTVTTNRNALSRTRIEALQLQKDWLRME